MKKVNLGYKYRLYVDEEQKETLDLQMYIYNQAYNICNNLWLKENEKNKKLAYEDRVFRKAVSYDKVVKRALNFRKLSYKTVVLQQARINFLKAVKKAFDKDTIADRVKAINNAITLKEKAKAFNLGFPKFQSSRDINQSFNWNNQGFTIKESENPKFKILRLMSMDLKFRHHRELPKNYKISSITISRDSVGYFVSFGIEFEIDLEVSINKNNLDISKSIGIDLNVNNIALSNGSLIDNGAKNRRVIKYSKLVKVLERKQSRRVLRKLKTKSRLSKNHKKTQNKINRINKKLYNQKNDLYHKISKTLTNKFELIVVEDLKLKNQMTKSAKGNELKSGKNVKQKAGLNRSILSASFYQFVSMIQYKQTMLNDKLLVKVNPQYTSQICNKCGYKDKNNRKTQSNFKCLNCTHTDNADINASKNILDKGLKSLGLGISLQTITEKPFAQTLRVC